MAFGAIVDKRGVEARLNRGDDPTVDVASRETALGDLHLEVLEHIAFDDGDPELFSEVDPAVPMSTL